MICIKIHSHSHRLMRHIANRSTKPSSTAQPNVKVSLPAAALFSFLKETRGTPTWTLHDMTRVLNISSAAAKQALVMLEMQGYAKPTESKGEWLRTPAGESVSSSKMPRYSRESVEQSLASFADHLNRVNEDSSAEYKIAEAVAFGDFLSKRARLQAADIGIKLEPRNRAARENSASEYEHQQTFLKQLRGRTPLVNLHPYADWMSARTHRCLM